MLPETARAWDFYPPNPPKYAMETCLDFWPMPIMLKYGRLHSQFFPQFSR